MIFGVHQKGFPSNWKEELRELNPIYFIEAVDVFGNGCMIPDLEVEMPYVVAIIKLEEGVQMLSNVVKCDPYKIKCDTPVEVTFEKLNDEFTLPKFRPVKD